MVAILVSGIVMMGVFAFATIQKDTANLQQRQVLLQQALEGSMHSIGTDLRMAGLGFGRTCSEIRIWSEAEGKLINPGAMTADNLGNVYVDQVTDEPYWVLRDGVQAHWRSGPDAGANTMAGLNATSASPSSAADSFDVFRGELNMVPGSGVFEVQSMPATSSGSAVIEFESSNLLDNGSTLQLKSVRQMFAPGSFVLVVPITATLSYVTEDQSQCALVQVTGEVEAGGGSTGWRLPIDNSSQFNANLAQLLNADGGATLTPTDASIGAVTDNNGIRFGADWDPVNTPRFELIPLGRARWSRYEIDYTVAERPMLVRADIIGWRDGDPQVATTDSYPGCTGGVCRMPTLYLPSNQIQPPRVAIGPMIEDMQVAVGCDGWTADSPPVANNLVPPPDPGFEEQGPSSGPLAGKPNRKVDERDEDDDRANDEWVGNANENWAPDCVSWGTGERNATQWSTSGPAFESQPAPGFRLSPQVVRVTLLAKPDTMAGGSDVADDPLYNQLVAIEDRPTMDSVVGRREYRILSERFSVRNSHWRDPALR
jgi:hypothetical protein